MLTREFVRTSGRVDRPFLISLAGQPCGGPRPCVPCKGGRRSCLGYVVRHAPLHRTYGAHQMHDHLSEPGMEESG
jgi:hypothetical protein